MRRRCESWIAGLLLLSACGSELPEERVAYANFWASEEVRLRIDGLGRVDYRRRSGSGEVSLNGPLRSFRGDDFVVGLPLLNTTFEVSEPPWHDGERWRMTVDGRELIGCPDGDCPGRWARGLSVEILEQGILGAERADGTRPITEPTSRVPLAPGRAFGVRYRLHDEARSWRTLTLIWETPPVCDTTRGGLRERWAVDDYTPPQDVHWASFDCETDCECAPGPWTLRILYGPKELARSSFLLYPG